MSVTGHLHSIHNSTYQVSRWPSRYEDIGDFRSLVKRPSDLNLSTFKRSYESSVSWASFLPIYALLFST